MNKPPLDDPQVRRALYLALDREEIKDIAGGGEGITGSWFPPGYAQTEEDHSRCPATDIRTAPSTQMTWLRPRGL